MSTPLRWGILGTGNIARQFATGLRSRARGTLDAVGSRTPEAASAFAQTYGIARAHASYDALADDPNIDAVYVSLPNNLHHHWTLRALRAGKHVLCEKPIAMNAAQASEMFAVARQQRRLLVEAFMYRTHPLTHAVLAAVRSGVIGQPRLVRTSFCYRTTKIAGNIRFDPALGGGALMDIGCYCVNFARLIADAEPDHSSVSGILHSSGVDEMAAGVLHFPGGLIASFTCGMGVQADNTAYVCGSEGFIEIPVPWKPPAQGASYVLARGTPPKMDSPTSAAPGPKPRETFTVDAGADLYGLEADAFASAATGQAPPFVTEADSLGNMRLLDALRAQLRSSR